MKEQVILLVSCEHPAPQTSEQKWNEVSEGRPLVYFANNSPRYTPRYCMLTETVPFCRDPETGRDLYPAVTVSRGREIKLAVALEELYYEMNVPVRKESHITEEERQKNMEAQEALCDRLELPMFLLDNGRCPACGGDMLSAYPESTYATHLITGCPLCGTSLCD